MIFYQFIGFRSAPIREFPYEISCNNKVGVACTAISDFYAQELSYDLTKYKYYAKKGCDFGDYGGCGNYGEALVKDKTDIKAGLRWLDKACSHGDNFACAKLGEFLLKLPAPYTNISKGLQYLEEASAVGVDSATQVLLAQYALGKNIPKDPPKALVYANRLPETPFNLAAKGFAYWVNQDMPKARFYFQKSCDGGQQAACSWLNNPQYNPR